MVVPAAIMADGEHREPFHALSGDDVRVPITSSPSTSQASPPGEEKDDDAFSTCKSIQDSLASVGSSTRDPAHEGENQVPYPALAPTVFFCLHQTTRPRNWCLKLVCHPYPFPSGLVASDHAPFFWVPAVLLLWMLDRGFLFWSV
uniref:Uncharacterized protein n=1 Tax=Sphaerodactylus townsendi TaxID=933632 RepID=A0ACB8FJH2_9SAUR